MHNLVEGKVNLAQYLNLIQQKYIKELGIKLPIFFGVDENGNIVVKDITQTKNIIIAGATGSGKSMFMHTALNTFMSLYSPESIKFVLIDPKLVELQLYENSPYLFSKVLKAVDIEEYFAQLENITKNKELENITLLVCIDTFSDLLYFNPIRFETIITKLSSMNNIYMIMSDSRPAPNVFTPNIMKLFSTKILMRTATDTDSMVFSGATIGSSLRGQGDAVIYFPNEQSPVRVQCPHIEYNEIGKLSVDR